MENEQKIEEIKKEIFNPETSFERVAELTREAFDIIEKEENGEEI